MLHYTAPPVVGGVEAVIDAHARIFFQMGYPVTIIAGQGSLKRLPDGCELQLIPDIDIQHPDIWRPESIWIRERFPQI